MSDFNLEAYDAAQYENRRAIDRALMKSHLDQQADIDDKLWAVHREEQAEIDSGLYAAQREYEIASSIESESKNIRRSQRIK